MSEKSGKAWWEERSRGEKAVMIVFFACIGAGLLFLFGAVVMWLWNWLMPDIFGLPELSYWQAWGLLILSSILFKDIDFGSDDRKQRRRERQRKERLREYMEEEIDEEDARPPEEDGVTSDEPDDASDHEESPRSDTGESDD